MTRVPFSFLVLALTAVAAAIAAFAKPGHADVLAGAALGTATAGAFAAAAVSVMTRIRATGGEQATRRMMSAFVGLMLARMVAYVALVLAAVFLGAGEPISVAIGLVGGTMVFQALEVAYLRKTT